MIETIGFTKSYKKHLAVENLHFQVQPGQIMGLLGPNGAGKTTTLRALAGVIRPTSGQVLIAGCDVVENPVGAKSSLAYIPDDPHLFDALTVWEHLIFAAEAYQVDDYVSKGERLLEEFELTEKRNTIAQELSRGMRQKTAICCAYLHDPAAILFDEPLTGLDPKAIRVLKDSIRARAQAGAAILLSSHLLALIQDICTHLLIIHQGKRLFMGDIHQAHGSFSDMAVDASLEDVFFRVTENSISGPDNSGEQQQG